MYFLGLYGRNSIESVPFSEGKKTRITNKWSVLPQKSPITLSKKELMPEFPMELMFAGSAYFIFSKAAIDFILKDEIVKKFFEWSKDTLTPGLIS